MNIVIIGAGTVGLHVASLLSKQGHSVILIDKNFSKLEEMSWQMDIAIKEGSGTDWQLLDDLLEINPDLFLALTGEDEINLVACSIAKQLGYPRTVARVKETYFLNRTRLDFSRLFNADYFISPELLVAYEIYKQLVKANSIAFENFAHGAVQMRTILVPSHWNQEHKTLGELQLPKGLIVGLICRRQSAWESPQVIFPHGDDRILPGDEITLIGEKDRITNIEQFFDLDTKRIDSVVIVGGSLVGLNLARILQERRIDVRLIEKDQKICLDLAAALPGCRVIHQDGTDLDFLLSEKVGYANYFVMCTTHDERNILGALIAKQAGCEHTAIILSNDHFIPLAERMGIDYVASPKLAAANQILSLATSKDVTSLVYLYENEAEILELTVSLNAKIIGIPLSEVGSQLPKDFLIAMIQNRGRISIAKGDSIISPGDTVIAICNPKYLKDLEKIF